MVGRVSSKYAFTLSVLVLFVVCLTSAIQSGMIGGFTERDANDTEYMDRAWKATKGVNDNASNEGPNHMIPIKVIKAKSQVVAGVKHVFEVLFGESNCSKGTLLASELSPSNCQLKSNGRRALYEIELWEKPWENFEQFNVKKLRNVEAGENI
ncbi:cystatin domain protein [Dictyocaulus viviparus]|uniref:Cystatin domain protein n=1 Tax=Dictyocaulus viviparus TaxID=29172 RepID=A0A0D8Y0V6_DICVI|nr:cystatin domain protein [Dictyocaulus viviparus]